MTALPSSVRRPHLELVPYRNVEPDLVAPPGLDEVEALMRELAELGHSPRAAEMVRTHLATGGKRLRARLALAAARAMGGSQSDAVVWAAAVELLHNATLIHDDIQDEDFIRRDRPTVWALHGTAQAMNAGDLMLMLPYLAVARLRSTLAGELSRAVAEHAITTVCGQVDEIDLVDSSSPSWATYRAAVAGKTGALLALPVYGATLLSGRSVTQATQLGDAFRDLGVLFQLQDDVLDLYGDKGRHRVGCDLYEGKVSALVVAHLARRPEERAWLLSLLRTPREDTRPDDVEKAIGRFVASGALSDVLDEIDAIAARTLDDAALQSVPPLRDVAETLVDLATRPIRHCRAISRGRTTSQRGATSPSNPAQESQGESA